MVMADSEGTATVRVHVVLLDTPFTDTGRCGMHPRRLTLLLELSRLGSMREVADALGTTTSTVSQQIAALAAETGAVLIEPHGRRVRLTPEGRRLATHAETILAAVEAARVDLDPDAEPAGTVRIAGFATALRRSLLPVIAELADTHPAVRVIVHEHEPAEATALLLSDAVDIALTYDYDLAPAAEGSGVTATALWTTAWALGVPADPARAAPDDALSAVRLFRHENWIVNSRGNADERVLRTLASMAGCEPTLTHRADSLSLVQDLIVAGLGVGLLPADQPTRPGVQLIPLRDPAVTLRSYAMTRRGRARWPPLKLVVDRLTARAG